MSSIAFIGTEGAGKTVLLAALAKTFGGTDETKPIFIPADGTTLKHVEHVWATLSSGDWPPSTPAGQRIDLAWSLRFPASAGGIQEIPIRAWDVAGQDIRLLFDQEQIRSSNLGAELTGLADYLREADVIVYVVNLRDFLGEPDPNRRASNQASIKTAMDVLHVNGAPKQFCLAFTQADQYAEELARVGGPAGAAREHLPHVYNAYLRGGEGVLALAAVYDTVIVRDARGKTLRVPAQKFRSSGLTKLLDWMIAAASSADQARAKVVATQQAAEERAKLRKAAKTFGKWVAAAVICIGLFWRWNSYETSKGRIRRALHRAEVQEINTLDRCDWVYYPWNDSITFRNRSEYTLTNVVLTVTYTLNGQTGTFQLSTAEIGPQGSCEWDGENVPALSHDFDAGPIYTSYSWTCDQTN